MYTCPAVRRGPEQLIQSVIDLQKKIRRTGSLTGNEQ